MSAIGIWYLARFLLLDVVLYKVDVFFQLIPRDAQLH